MNGVKIPILGLKKIIFLTYKGRNYLTDLELCWNVIMGSDQYFISLVQWGNDTHYMLYMQTRVYRLAKIIKVHPVHSHYFVIVGACIFSLQILSTEPQNYYFLLRDMLL